MAGVPHFTLWRSYPEGLIPFLKLVSFGNDRCITFFHSSGVV